jgi:cell division protein FtsW (lipid II flippase)
MNYFLFVFGFAAALVVALCSLFDLQVRIRVFWALVDVVLLAYLCLVNGWFRNKTLRWINWISRRESCPPAAMRPAPNAVPVAIPIASGQP